jgi:hypothetical protein
MRALGNTFIAGFVIVLTPALVAQSAPTFPALSPSDLIRAVVANELKPESGHSHWMYEVDKEEDGKKQTRQVIQTHHGTLERLVAIDGHSLSPGKQQEESARIEKLAVNAQELRKLEESRKRDSAQCEAFFRMIPDAFLFQYAGREGEFVKLAFKPNPSFQPPSREARVLHALEGEILVQAQQLRLAAISGHLVEEVKFAGGLLGYLEKGGTFTVKRVELAPSQWMLADLAVNMNGKALFFKTIAVQQKESRSNFRKVAEDMTLSDAARLLTNPVALAANR